MLSYLNGFLICRANPYILLGDVYFSGTEYCRELNFSMQTYLNVIFEYCNASVILDYFDVLYLKYWNGCRPVLKSNTTIIGYF